jgi:hypothetical protein
VSRRARHARRLASLLSTASRGVHVQVQYDRATGRYCVIWTGGPEVAAMQRHTRANANEVPLLDLDALDWRRHDPASDPVSRYDYGT